MSRNVNIDLRTPLKDIPLDDLRYALDRNLFDAEDQVRVDAFLRGDPEAEPTRSELEDQDEELTSLLATLKGSVGEVMARINDMEDLTQDQLAILVANEKSNKDRKTLLEFLEEIEFEDEDTEEPKAATEPEDEDGENE